MRRRAMLCRCARSLARAGIALLQAAATAHAQEPGGREILERVERVIKIPPSMMLQPWLGSDLGNDDLAKESRIRDDDTQTFLGTTMVEGQASTLDSRPIAQRGGPR